MLILISQIISAQELAIENLTLTLQPKLVNEFLAYKQKLAGLLMPWLVGIPWTMSVVWPAKVF
ncbi:hypothetical protein N478_10655 [Pseudoalteromonas luteoviolacea S4060-1]|uniref:Uncharacterized protein n=1 Tax=Pseudoalteromonas luteoviolacea S4060-1 TaxID=1365257 RepID=A0A167P6E7_9GAMM|nr:hypothetical protein N478_10655 [Pseudoalteromonas luteoviolacea S4060-1]